MADTAVDAPPVEAPPPAVEAPPAALTPEQEEAALDAQIEEQAIPLPDGTDKLVPLAAVTTLRGKLKEARAELATAKTGGEKATQLEAEIADLKAQLGEAVPYANAYKVALQQERQPPAPTGPTQEEREELEEIARDELYYKDDGSLDIARATRHRDRIHRAAEKIAQAHVAPLQQQTVAQASRGMLVNAKLTKAPDGTQPDPQILEDVWNRLDPSITATKAGAIQAWNSALGFSVAMGRAITAKAATREPLPTPLVIEKAGGRDPVVPTASAADERAAKDLDMTVADYLKEVNSMPTGWGRTK